MELGPGPPTPLHLMSKRQTSESDPLGWRAGGLEGRRWVTGEPMLRHMRGTGTRQFDLSSRRTAGPRAEDAGRG